MAESQNITTRTVQGMEIPFCKELYISIVVLFPMVNKTLKCQNCQGINILGEKLAWIDKNVFILAQIFFL